MITVILAAIAWFFTQLHEEIKSKPIISYKHYEYNEVTKKITVRIENLSEDTLFEDLTVMLRIDVGSTSKCLGSPEYILYSPNMAIKDDTKILTKPKCIDDSSAEYSIVQLQPGAIIDLDMYISSKEEVLIHLFSKKAIRVVEANFKTYLIKYRFNLILVFLFFWLILFFYLALLFYNYKKVIK